MVQNIVYIHQDSILSHKSNHNIFKLMKITKGLFYDCKRKKLKLKNSNESQPGKSSDTWN